MKNVFLPVFLLIFYLQLNAQVSKTEKLLTTRSWLIENEAGKILNYYELRKLCFNKDGSLTLIKLSNDDKKTGNWKLEQDGKTLTVNLDKRLGLVFEISSIDSKALKFLKDGEITTAVNVPNNYKLPRKEYSEKLLGTWLFFKVNGESVEDKNMLIQFKSDGTAISSNQHEASKWETRKNQLTLDGALTEAFGFEVTKDKKILKLSSVNFNAELIKTNKIATLRVKKE